MQVPARRTVLMHERRRAEVLSLSLSLPAAAAAAATAGIRQPPRVRFAFGARCAAGPAAAGAAGRRGVLGEREEQLRIDVFESWVAAVLR